MFCLQMLRAADPEIFSPFSDYAITVNVKTGRQPIVVDHHGNPLDGQQYKFIGQVVTYRGRCYASTDPRWPYIGFTETLPKSGWPAPMCCKQPYDKHGMFFVSPMFVLHQKDQIRLLRENPMSELPSGEKA